MLILIMEVTDVDLIVLIFLYYVGNLDFLTLNYFETDSGVVKMYQFFQSIKMIA